MRSAVILSALASLVAASPAPPQYHTLSFTVLNNTTVVSAVLLETTKGNYVLQAERPSVYQGTQAFFTGSGASEGLLFLPNSYTTAGASVPSVGDDYGYAAPITVAENSQGDEGWDFVPSTGGLYHTQQAALENFFACETKINGKNATVLSWGVPRNAKSGLAAPKGCSYTTVYVGNYTSQSS